MCNVNVRLYHPIEAQTYSSALCLELPSWLAPTPTPTSSLTFHPIMFYCGGIVSGSMSGLTGSICHGINTSSGGVAVDRFCSSTRPATRFT